MRNGTVFFKPYIFLPALALVTVAFFSSCQKTSTSSTDIGDWANLTEIQGVPRTQAVAFNINGTEYIGGGYNGNTNTRLNDFYRFDEANNHSWIEVDNFPGIARQGASGFSINGKGYIVGGYDGTNYYNDVWQFDPSQPAGSQWDSVGIVPSPFVPRTNAIGFNIGSKGYVGTGLDISGNSYNDLWSFDGTNWTSVQPLFKKRSGASVFIYNNIAYVVGGVDKSTGTYLPDLAAYDPTNPNGWIKLRNIINDGSTDSTYEANYGTNILRSNAAAFVINDTAYLATGTYNGILNTTWAYDIKNDQWFQKTSFEGTAREGAIGFSVNNHGYIATGDNGSNYFYDVWQFYPDAAQTNADNY